MYAYADTSTSTLSAGDQVAMNFALVLLAVLAVWFYWQWRKEGKQKQLASGIQPKQRRSFPGVLPLAASVWNAFLYGGAARVAPVVNAPIPAKSVGNESSAVVSAQTTGANAADWDAEFLRVWDIKSTEEFTRQAQELMHRYLITQHKWIGSERRIKAVLHYTDSSKQSDLIKGIIDQIGLTAEADRIEAERKARLEARKATA